MKNEPKFDMGKKIPISEFLYDEDEDSENIFCLKTKEILTSNDQEKYNNRNNFLSEIRNPKVKLNNPSKNYNENFYNKANKQ